MRPDRRIAGSGCRFIPNLSMFWPHETPYERFRRAQAAGFGHAELWFPQTLDRRLLEQAIRSSRVDLVLFDLAPGDLAAGELGLLCVPGREDDFRRSLDEALELARSLGTSLLNVLVGIVPNGVPRGTAEATALANLRAAAPEARRAGVTLLVEAINSTDYPGYLASTIDAAAELVAAVGSAAVRLQLDAYHVAMEGTDPVAAVRKHRGSIGHVQIADRPGRHEPGTGRLPFDELFAELTRLEYQGYVGLEYDPLEDTDTGLEWLPRGARA